MRSALKSTRRIAAAALFAGALSAAISFTPGVTADPANLRVRFGGDSAETRVVIDADRAVSGRVEQDGSSDGHVVIHLSNVDAASGLAGQGRGLVRNWSLERAGGGSRLALDLSRGATVRRRFLLPPADGNPGYRYVIDLAAASGPAAPARPAASGSTAPAPPAQQLTPPPAARAALRAPPARRPNARRVIVIDAGHGGRDPGALGADHHEKEITLAAARALRRSLERTGRYQVVLTRNSDVYVPLERRVQIARRANADLFISLHADAGPDATRRGASVYTLSEEGGSRVTRVLGRNEWFMGSGGAIADRSVSRILLDLTQRSTRNRSANFAQLLVDHISDRVPMLPRSHRDAGYFVLLAPDVPAVLLEMGFITNRDDEALLSDSGARGGFMQAVADAIDAYFAEETTLAES